MQGSGHWLLLLTCCLIGGAEAIATHKVCRALSSGKAGSGWLDKTRALSKTLLYVEWNAPEQQ